MKIVLDCISSSQSDTSHIASKFVKSVKNQSIIYLSGDLGTGKTFFVSTCSQFYGLTKISSPTYSRVSVYNGQVNLIHCDFYLVDNHYEFLCNEVEPLLVEPWLLFVEWPSEILNIDCSYEYDIRITMNDNNSKRRIVITRL